MRGLLEVFPAGITAVRGILAAGVRAGIKRKGLDVMVVANQGGPVPAAGAFTTNLVKGAPLLVTREHLDDGKLGAVVGNSGNANSCTGPRGLRDAREMARLGAEGLGLKPREVGVASTGLIGSPLPMAKLRAGIRAAVAKLSSSPEAGLSAARAMMTTDTFPKQAAVRVKLQDGTRVTIAGFAKGAGMIRPRLNVATMFALIVTDAQATPAALRLALGRAVERSFNMITVDGDTSTNDMVLVLANGLAGNRELTSARLDPRFQAALDHLLVELAKLIASDGEGSTKLIEVKVRGARTEREARQAALAVAGSNLVKAAVHGEDPNWGRAVAALGYSGASFDPDRLSLGLRSSLGEASLIKRGKPCARRVLGRARAIMGAREIKIEVDLAAGEAEATAWGCDLTPEYVRINSRYTT